MASVRSGILVLAAMLLLPVSASAVPIEVTGQGDADGLWDVTTILCDRSEGIGSECDQQLTQQVWYGSELLARAFAEACSLCLGYPNFPASSGGSFTPFFRFLDWSVESNHLGVASTSVELNFAGYWIGGTDLAYYAVAERIPVPAPATLAMLALGLMGFGVARRSKS